MQVVDTQKIKGRISLPSPESLKESYKRMMGHQIAKGQAKSAAQEELFTENWMKKNPGAGLEQAKRAYAGRPGTLLNPAKAPDPNSPEIKFGKKTF